MSELTNQSIWEGRHLSDRSVSDGGQMQYCGTEQCEKADVFFCFFLSVKHVNLF